MRTIHIFDKYIRKVSETLSILGAVWIFIVMGVIVWDVLGRLLFNTPFLGTSEIVRNSIVGIAFFMIPWAMVQDRHVRSSVIIENVSPNIQRWLNVLAYSIGLALFLAIIYASWTPMMKAWAIKEYEGEGALRVPTYPVRTLIVIGSALTSWHCFMILISLIAPKVGKKVKQEVQ